MGNTMETVDRIRTILMARSDVTQSEALLRELLNSLDRETLRRVEAIMYSGRGDGSAADLRTTLEKSHPAQGEVVRTIIEKLPNLEHYLEQGLDRANEEGIDPDTF